jgi:cytochrome P450
MTPEAKLTARPHYAPLLDLDQAALRCPYPYFERMREEAPVEWIEELGCYAVTRYDDVIGVLRNPEVFSSYMPTGPKATAATLETMQELIMEAEELRPLIAEGFAVSSVAVLLNADPPAHDRQRALVSRAFSPRRVRSMEPSIQKVADALVDAFISDGHCELVRDFAVGLPLTVIADALGVPDGDLPTFKRWSDDFVAVIGNHHLSKDDLAGLVRSQAEFFRYFTDKIEERRAEPRDDLISDVVHATIEDAEPLTTTEMLGMFSQFLVAGNETTTKLLASGMLLLLRQPEVMQQVRDDPALIPGLVEEALRLEAPVQGLFRSAKVATEVGGVAIPAGSSLWCLYASANRDDREFQQPEQVDLERSNAKAHLSFGNGIHYCVGAALSRVEARIGFETILRRLDDIRLDGDEGLLEYEPSYALHGLKALPLRFTARR